MHSCITNGPFKIQRSERSAWGFLLNDDIGDIRSRRRKSWHSFFLICNLRDRDAAGAGGAMTFMLNSLKGVCRRGPSELEVGQPATASGGVLPLGGRGGCFSRDLPTPPGSGGLSRVLSRPGGGGGQVQESLKA